MCVKDGAWDAENRKVLHVLLSMIIHTHARTHHALTILHTYKHMHRSKAGVSSCLASRPRRSSHKWKTCRCEQKRAD
jgi:hypothetical protein